MNHSDSSSLEGKTALVTGGSRGLGRGVVEALASKKMRVVAVARDAGRLEALAREVPGVETIAADAADGIAAGRIQQDVRPDVLVLCAGAAPLLRPIHLHTWESFSQNWEMDAKMAFTWLRDALLLPMRPGGHVVVVSSGAAVQGSPLSGGYAAAKRAQWLVADYAAKESERLGLGLRVHCVLRMVGHPDDAADLVQESLLRAFTGVGQFRRGARFATWLCSIAAHACIDHLRRQKRWRPYSQAYAEQECAGSPEMRQEILNLVADPGFSFDAHEHIAACFTCVARSLPPVQEAALVLREIFEYSNQEAADALGMTEPVLRNHLAAARGSMTATYEGLCALVNKQGICHQCAGFQNAASAGRKGPPVVPLGAEGDGPEARFRVRLSIVRESPFADGVSRKLHDLLFDRIRRQEAREALTGG